MSVLHLSRPSLSSTRASSTPNSSPRKKLPPLATSSPAPTEKQSTRKPLVDREEIVQRSVGVPRKPLPGSGKTLWQNLRDSGVSVIARSSNCDTLNLPFQCSMLDPLTAYEGLSRSETRYHAWVAVRNALDDIERVESMSVKNRALRAMENYRVEVGAMMMDIIPGKHFTFVDPTLYERTDQMVAQAERLIRGFEKKGISRVRIIISIPATEAGVHAAQLLKKKTVNISTNLTHVSGFIHASICVEAGADVITFCCEPMLSAYKILHPTNMGHIEPCDHPCIQAMQMTIEYFRLHRVKTQIAATHLHGSSSAAPLRVLDYVAVVDANIQDIMECGVPSNSPPADASPNLRARQAQYPTKYLAGEKNGVFLKDMSAKTRSLAVTTLAHGINEGKQYTKRVFKYFREEVEEELTIREMDAAGLAKLYEPDVWVARAIINEENNGVPQAEIARMFQDVPKPRYDHLGFRLCQSWSQIAADTPISELDDLETRLIAERITGDPIHCPMSPKCQKTEISADLDHIPRPPTPLSTVEIRYGSDS